MSMVYPMYTNMSERAKATKDLSNLRQIGIATQTYLNDTDGSCLSPTSNVDDAAGTEPKIPFCLAGNSIAV